MKTFILFALFISFSLISFGQNKIIETSADLKSVTIYNSSAELSYQKDVAIPQGKSTIVFTDLTPFIVDNTINISSSSADVNIITVTEKINYTKVRKDLNSKISILMDSITQIETEVGLLTCKIDALNSEKNLLFKDESIGGVSKGVSVAEIEKASTFYSKRYLDLSTDLYKSNERIKALETKLSNFKKQLDEISSNTLSSGSEIQVTVTNFSSKTVTFSFKFLTTKSGWAPAYDCKYLGADKPIEFIFRANVFNATGISWENVDIKLSTANPTEGFNTPSFNSKNNRQIIKEDEEVKFKTIQVANSIAEYDIKHKYSIPSDSKPYLVDVNSYSIKAEFYYLVIPKLDPFGFLMAKIPDWNKLNLIPGTTNVYNKGSFMGKTFLNTYAENDTLSLYLGKDHNIQSIRKEVNSDPRKSLIGNSIFDRAEISISIKNNSSDKYDFIVLDQVPVFGENEKVKYNIENIEQAIYDKKEGLLTWYISLNTNESKNIEYSFDIKISKSENRGYSPERRKLREISCPSF